MQCPKCQFENREEAIFCRSCGTSLENDIICPNCKASNPHDSKFCEKCGQNLKPSEKIQSIQYSEPQSYTPQYLANKILTTRSSIEGERKIVSVLFADVANYTAMSEKLDPEEVHQIMDGCFKILMDEIHKYEGTINQFTGDGVMALFGAPVAHEDHAQRACYAALSIRKSMGEYGDKIEKDTGVEFKLRIGLNSGPVIVGAIGNDLRMDYTAVGDTTNLASRMQSTAQPGTIFVSKNTFRLVKEFFEFKILGKLKVKGKEEVQETFELIKASEVETRIEASMVKGLTRFVGRKNSMAALMDAFNKVKSGSGQVVGLVGEAGVGKSRLLWEMRNTLPQGEYNYLEGKCLHFGGSMAYLPILDILRSYFEIKKEDREYIIKNKMNKRIIDLDDKLMGVIPPLQELLSLKVDDKRFILLEPEQKRERTFEALRDLMLRGSEEKPLVIAVEDVHWIDKTSEQFIDYVIEWLANNSILLILLYRPEYTHQWGSKSYYSKIGLNQLGIHSSAELLKAILEGGEVAPELRQLIFDRAAGNPLFLEEFTHTLIENGSIEKKGDNYFLTKKTSDIRVPDTIQGIISARMDRLEENLKRTMQVASVIGRDFAFRILQTITGMREELKSYLLNLQGLEFIYEKRLLPELEYIFKHALIQEVAYHSLLTKRRSDIHMKIGEAIETLYADKLEEFYEMLAYHYSESEDAEKAIMYRHLAGRRALKLYAMDEASHHFTICMHIIEKLPSGNNKRDLKLEIGTKLGFTYLIKNMFAKAREIVKPLKELATEEKHLRSLGRIYTATGVDYVVNKLKFEKGISYLEKSIALSKKTNDMPALSFGCTYLAGSYALCGNFDAAETLYNQIILVLEEKQSWYTLAVLYNSMSALFCEKADAENAEKWSYKAYKCIEKIDDFFTKSWGNLAMGHFFLQKGHLEEAEKKLIAALYNAKKFSLHVAIEPCLVYLSELYFKMENNDYALKHINELKNMIELEKSPILYLCNCLVIEAMIYIQKGEYNKALKCLEKGLKFKVPQFEGNLYRVFGDYYRNLCTDNYPSAQEWYEKAIKIDNKIGRRLELARDYYNYGKLQKKIGAQEDASKYFNESLASFNAFGAIWDINQVKAAIEDL